MEEVLEFGLTPGWARVEKHRTPNIEHRSEEFHGDICEFFAVRPGAEGKLNGAQRSARPTQGE
jgi:hypothetical protein